MAYKSSHSKSVTPMGSACKKAMYNSREEAEDMIRYINENRIVKELYTYECPTCGMWHLTSRSK